MALLFVGGVMNFLWVAVLAAVVLIEKLFPLGVWMARIGGVLLAAYGIGLLAMSRLADAVPPGPAQPTAPNAGILRLEPGRIIPSTFAASRRSGSS